MSEQRDRDCCENAIEESKNKPPAVIEACGAEAEQAKQTAQDANVNPMQAEESTAGAVEKASEERVGEEGGLAGEELLAALEAELAEVREAHLRAVADLQNYRRRVAEERAQLIQFANEQLIRELLPVLDNFERATNCVVQGEEARNLQRGVCMVQQQFREVLAHFGVERMTTVGECFDPAKHEAVERVETDETPEGVIVEEVLPGYTMHGRVIRPAKVKVAVPRA